MQAGSKNCFQIKVNTTNGMNDTFNLDGKYFDCENGHVYVLADTIEDAARMIPSAVAIKRIGFGMMPTFPAPVLHRGGIPTHGNIAFPAETPAHS